MSGYFSATKNLSELDFRYVKRNAKVVGNYCKTHKSDTVMNAMRIGTQWLAHVSWCGLYGWRAPLGWTAQRMCDRWRPPDTRGRRARPW